jgi:hypothetical protein
MQVADMVDANRLSAAEQLAYTLGDECLDEGAAGLVADESEVVEVEAVEELASGRTLRGPGGRPGEGGLVLVADHDEASAAVASAIGLSPTTVIPGGEILWQRRVPLHPSWPESP